MKSTTERVMVLSDPKIGTTDSVLQASGMEVMLGREGDVLLVNGQQRPRASSTAGQVERWRLVNGSASHYHRLSVRGASMLLIAGDQGRLAAPQHVDQLVLTPGQRAEVLVPLEHAGTVTLHSAAVDRGGVGGMMGASAASADLFTLQVSSAGQSTPPTLPTSLRTEPAAPAPDRSRSFTLAMAMGMGGGGMGGGMGGGAGGVDGFTINGVSFDPNRVDTHVVVGTAEEWTIANTSMMDHPFHLHVWPMKVMSRSDGSTPDPGWRDTVNVPAGQSVVVRIRFSGFAGTAVYHCHILDHEDRGMMGIINVA
jgi:FtsP/CotA-like multicopper oxidase with cupredoxin domain